MRYLIAAALMLLTPVALAADPATITPEVIESILVTLLGSKGATIALVITLATGIWSQLRPYIPNTWLAKLPGWLLAFLEWWAGNRREAANDRTMSAEAIRARSKL